MTTTVFSNVFVFFPIAKNIGNLLGLQALQDALNISRSHALEIVELVSFQILQNLGKADKTRDELFDEYLINFNKQQVISSDIFFHFVWKIGMCFKYLFVHCLECRSEAEQRNQALHVMYQR